MDDDDESVIMIGGRPFILQCGRKRRSSREVPERSMQLGGSSSLGSSEFGSSSGQRSEVGESEYRRSAASSRFREVSGASARFREASAASPMFREASAASSSYGESSSGEYPRVSVKDFLGETGESASGYDPQNAEYQRGLLKDFLNETMEAESASYDGEYQRGLLKDFLIEPDASVECLNYDSMDSLDIIEITDEEDAVLESPAKRRCSSYNYIMGLSDPDSESESADL